MQITSTFWILDITDWWRQQEETHSVYADLSNLACDIFYIIPHGVRVEASYSLAQYIIGCSQTKTTRETLRKQVVVMEFAQANNGIVAGDNQALNMTKTETSWK